MIPFPCRRRDFLRAHRTSLDRRAQRFCYSQDELYLEAALLGEEQKGGCLGGSRGFNVIYTTDDELVSKCEITILPASYPSSSFYCVPATMNSEPTRSQELSEKGSPYDGASSTSNSNDNGNNSNSNSNDNEKSAVVVKSQDDQDEASSTSVSEVFDVKQFDPVLARKMALVNQAIDEIGMTSFQWNLFWLNGFGYTVDSVCSSRRAVLSLRKYHVVN